MIQQCFVGSVALYIKHRDIPQSSGQDKLYNDISANKNQPIFIETENWYENDKYRKKNCNQTGRPDDLSPTIKRKTLQCIYHKTHFKLYRDVFSYYTFTLANSLKMEQVRRFLISKLNLGTEYNPRVWYMVQFSW